jgi:hypothetical protein
MNPKNKDILARMKRRSKRAHKCEVTADDAELVVALRLIERQKAEEEAVQQLQQRQKAKERAVDAVVIE